MNVGKLYLGTGKQTIGGPLIDTGTTSSETVRDGVLINVHWYRSVVIQPTPRRPWCLVVGWRGAGPLPAIDRWLPRALTRMRG